MLLATKLRLFATQLASQCRDMDEVELLFIQRAGVAPLLASQSRFPRLHLMVSASMKDVLALPLCQQALKTAWLECWPQWKHRSFISAFHIFLIRVLTLPLLALLYLLQPDLRISHQQQAPFSRFINYLASYNLFLIAVFLQNCLGHPSSDRGPPNSGLEIFIALYSLGLALNVVREGLSLGVARYFRQWWSWFDITVSGSLLILLITWFVSLLDVTYVNPASRYTERRFWGPLSLPLISEALFCIITVQVFVRLFFICRLHPVLGPLQVSLTRMFANVVVFLVFFLLMLLAFVTALMNLHEYYRDMVVMDQSGTIHHTPPSFTSLPNTIDTLFWAMFTKSPMDSGSFYISDTPESGNTTENIPVAESHQVTELTGMMLFATFQFVSNIVMVNMLVAMMTNSFNLVQCNADTEWKFSRTELWAEYLRRGEHFVLPPPYNLVPIRVMQPLTKLISYIITCIHEHRGWWRRKWGYSRVEKEEEGREEKQEEGEREGKSGESGEDRPVVVRCTPSCCCFRGKYEKLEMLSQDKKKYEDLILILVERYIRQRSRKHNGN